MEDQRIAESTLNAPAMGEVTSEVQVDEGDFAEDLKDEPNGERKEHGDDGRSMLNDGEEERSFVVEDFEYEFLLIGDVLKW